MSEPTELLPCPFCGGEAELKQYQSGDWQVICYHVDGCIMLESDLDNCYWDNVQVLARQWNQRHVETCENMREKFGYKRLFVCSECGVTFDPDCEINYCPCCGRKVVDNAD